MATWKGDPEKPVVSICCITYNHEPYIEDALEGFLIQDTDFPFEILIHDDASTDRTADIIREYEAKYPKLIKPIYQVENQYSKGNRATMIVFPLCAGKYIAVCEGDDYWCDPSKLSKQTAYLEMNDDVVISSHDAFIIDEDRKKVKDSKLPDSHKRDYSSNELKQGKGWLLTMNLMIRNIAIPEIPERRMVKNGDNFLVSILGQYGGSHHHDDIKPSAYRLHAGGVWSALPDQIKIEEQINTWLWIYRYYQRIGDKECAAVYWSRFLNKVVQGSSKKSLLMLVIRNSIPERLISMLRPIKKSLFKDA
ncbi:glycosyltransferase [Marinospirillum sp.]|uniref:glycosyltransferase family 2 protein n=1 Tax=Marinospirillum sp. TaxID=2183934 RepID=UPI0025BE57C5|nr:glycosyltransferase [Marinospirillum sp.]